MFGTEQFEILHFRTKVEGVERIAIRSNGNDDFENYVNNDWKIRVHKDAKGNRLR